MASPEIIAVGTLNNVTTGANAPTIPTHQADDILVVPCLLWAPNSTGWAVSGEDIQVPTGWNLLGSRRQLDNGFDTKWGQTVAFWRRATGAGHTISITRPTDADSGSDTSWGAFAMVIRGCVTTGDPFDQAVSSSPYTTANQNVNAVNVAGSERLVVHCLIRSDDYSTEPSVSGWNTASVQESGTGQDASMGVFYKTDQSSQTSADASTTQAPAAGFYTFHSASFKPPAGGPTGTGAVSFPFSTDGTGSEEFTGTGAPSFPFVPSGTGYAFTGTGAPVLAFSIGGTGYMFTGTGGSSFPFSTASQAAEEFTGTGGSSFPFSTDGTGDVPLPVEGSGAVAFPFATSSTGEENFTGTGGATFLFSTASTAEESYTGTGGATFPFATDAAGSESFTGTGNPVLPFATDGVGSQEFTGTSASSFPFATDATGEAVESITGTGASSFGFAPAISAEETFIGQTGTGGGGDTTVGQDDFSDGTPDVGGPWTLGPWSLSSGRLVENDPPDQPGYQGEDEEQATTTSGGNATLDTVGADLGDGYVQTNLVGGHLIIRGHSGYEYIISGGTLCRYSGGTYTVLANIGGSGTWYRLQATGVSPTALKVERRTTQGALGTGWLIETSDNTAAWQAATGYVGVGTYKESYWTYYESYGWEYEGSGGENGDVDDFLAVSLGGGGGSAGDVFPFSVSGTGVTYAHVGTADLSFLFTISGDGSEEFTGTGDPVLGFSTDGTGEVVSGDVSGTGAVVFPFASDGAGNEEFTGTAVPAFPFSTDGTGAETFTGTEAASFAFSTDALGLVGFNGTGGTTFTFASDSVGALTFTGTGDPVLPFSTSGAGDVSGAEAVEGTGAVTFLFAHTAEGAITFTGTGSVQFPFAISGWLWQIAGTGGTSFGIATSGQGQLGYSGSGASTHQFSVDATGVHAEGVTGTGGATYAWSVVATASTPTPVTLLGPSSAEIEMLPSNIPTATLLGTSGPQNAMIGTLDYGVSGEGLDLNDTFGNGGSILAFVTSGSGAVA